MNSCPIALFAILLGVYFLQYRHSKNYLLLFLIGLYFLSAVMSFFLYDSNQQVYNDINIVSYVFLFVSIFIAFLPIAQFKAPNTIDCRGWTISYADTYSIILILLFLPSILSSVNEIRTDIVSILADLEYGAELYRDTEEIGRLQTGRNLSNLPSVIRGSFSEIIVFWAFYYTTLDRGKKRKKKRKKKVITALLWVCVLSPFLSSFSQGSRTMMTWWLLEIMICLFIFTPFYSEKVKKIIIGLSAALCTAVLASFLILTIARFSTGEYANNSVAGSSLISYVGQSTLNFADDITQNTVTMNGDNSFPLFRRMVGLNSSGNLYERQAYWSSRMNIRQGSFYTFIGDFYMDFGPIIGFMFLLISSICMCTLVNKQNIINRLFILFICCCICYNGLFYFSYKTIGGNLKLITSALFYILLLLTPRKSRE